MLRLRLRRRHRDHRYPPQIPHRHLDLKFHFCTHLIFTEVPGSTSDRTALLLKPYTLYLYVRGRCFDSGSYTHTFLTDTETSDTVRTKTYTHPGPGPIVLSPKNNSYLVSSEREREVLQFCRYRQPIGRVTFSVVTGHRTSVFPTCDSPVDYTFDVPHTPTESLTTSGIIFSNDPRKRLVR